MRSLPFCVFIVAACGGGNSNPDAPIVVVPDAPPDAPPDSPPPPDAQEFDFSCENDAPVTTAPATLTIAGSVNDINLIQMAQVPVEGATVNAFRNGTAQPIATDTSDNAGAFDLTLTTGGTAVDGFIEVSKQNTHHTVRVYPPNPLVASQANLPALLLSNTTFGQIQTFAGVNPQFAVIVLDCAGTPINGVTLTIKQGNTDVGSVFDANAFQPGLFFVENVPVGDTQVGATFPGHTLHTHTIASVDGTLSTTIVTPRP